MNLNDRKIKFIMRNKNWRRYMPLFIDNMPVITPATIYKEY